MASYERLPPGTQRIEDTAGKNILLAPQPPADPNHPLNWSKLRKSVHMVILCFYALMVFATLCVSVPLWQIFNEELGISYPDLNNTYASNMAALSVGCILFIPIALRFGRRPIYIVTTLIMLASAIWQAKMMTLGDMIGNNIIMGIAGAVNEALFQVTVADLFFVHQRGTMNGIYLVLVVTGKPYLDVTGVVGPRTNHTCANNRKLLWSCRRWLCRSFLSRLEMGLLVVYYLLVHLQVIATPLEHERLAANSFFPFANHS